ncbi:MAG: hypothetical protein KGO51_09970 [Alphaproteobacteria bacterium]|nr:hypothetical protein [Alphaproteobacteria bacterium]
MPTPFRSPTLFRSPNLALTSAVILALVLAFASVAAQAQVYSAEAQRVLAQARAASGGAGWYSLRGWHEVGRKGGVRYEAWLDPVRYGMRVETHEPNGLLVHGFNGAGDWTIFPSGQKTGRDIRKLITETRSDAFFDVHGYLFPGRFDARAASLGVKTWRGRPYDVVRVKPWAGVPRELWFDRRTHLLVRMVDSAGPRPFAIDYSDYRKVGPVRVAFRATTEGGEALQIDSLDFRPADRSLFSLPRPTADDAQAAPAPTAHRPAPAESGR